MRHLLTKQHHSSTPWQLVLFVAEGREGQCCDQACTNQLASLITSHLYTWLSLIFMYIHGICWTVKKKCIYIYIGTTEMIESLVPQKRFHEAYDLSSDSLTIGWLSICLGNERRASVWVGNPRVILLELSRVNMCKVWLFDTFPCVCSSFGLSRRRDERAIEFSFIISLSTECVKLVSFWNSWKDTGLDVSQQTAENTCTYTWAEIQKTWGIYIIQ
jgi:hypothetical protein